MTAKSLDFFRRYESIVDDWESFADYARKPLPATIWTNTLKTSPEKLASRIPLDPVSWYPGAFRFPKDLKPSTLLPYLAGHYQIQEEAALLPVYLMDPQPHETILDMCAAPGNKTVQMAVAMQSTGLVVANDRSRARLGILRRSVSRLGLTNIAMTVYDATSFRGEPETYDKVLADVPCSGEGTIRRHKKSAGFISRTRRTRIQNIQKAILDKSIKLCKPGGLIVYSTCTFAPEENESVIQAGLTKYQDQISLVPSDITGLKTTPGLLSWEGKPFHPGMQNAHRIWPHHNDTGGFFVAVIKKHCSVGASSKAIKGAKMNTLTLSDSTQDFQERFGIPGCVFDGMALQQYGKFLSIRSFENLPPEAPPAIQAGLPFCRPAGKSQKMKTGAAMKWGEAATRNIIELSIDQAYAYGNRMTFQINLDQLTPSTTPGYVLLKHQDMHLGLGFLRVHNGEATIESLLPRHWIHTLVRH